MNPAVVLFWYSFLDPMISNVTFFKVSALISRENLKPFGENIHRFGSKSSNENLLTAIKEAAKHEDHNSDNDNNSSFHNSHSLDYKTRKTLKKFKIKLQKILLRNELKRSEIVIAAKMLQYMQSSKFPITKIIVCMCIYNLGFQSA